MTQTEPTTHTTAETAGVSAIATSPTTTHR